MDDFEKKKELFLKQKETLDTFLKTGAISRQQYDKSYGDLVKKMGMENVAECVTDKELLMLVEKIEKLLETECWIIDVLPRRVSKARAKQYSDLEKVFLHSEELVKKHYNIILKLNCYYKLKIVAYSGEDLGDADPEKLLKYIGHKPVYLLLANSLLSLDPDDMHMTLYNPTNAILALMKKIASSEGMFVWSVNGDGSN